MPRSCDPKSVPVRRVCTYVLVFLLVVQNCFRPLISKHAASLIGSRSLQNYCKSKLTQLHKAILLQMALTSRNRRATKANGVLQHGVSMTQVSRARTLALAGYVRSRRRTKILMRNLCWRLHASLGTPFWPTRVRDQCKRALAQQLLESEFLSTFQSHQSLIRPAPLALKRFATRCLRSAFLSHPRSVCDVDTVLFCHYTTSNSFKSPVLLVRTVGELTLSCVFMRTHFRLCHTKGTTAE